ncbi:MAG: expansin EXLX1 family cellulose-binding protein [Chloroflexota bacterium]
MSKELKLITLSALLLLILICQAVWNPLSIAFGQEDESLIWLPFIMDEGSETSINPTPTPTPTPNSNPVNQGIATYYNATGRGACSFDASPNDLMVAAMNAEEYDNAAYCGSYVEVTGPQGTITVRIVDLCPECKAGHLDLSREAFAEIAEIVQGRVDISWQLVSPPLDSPIAYRFKDGSNQWWTAVQVRNHRNPIAKLEYLNDDNQWIEVERTSYNYFVQTGPGMGPGPFTFRVTDSYGNQLTDSGIEHIELGTVSGSGQFPIGP